MIYGAWVGTFWATSFDTLWDLAAALEIKYLPAPEIKLTEARPRTPHFPLSQESMWKTYIIVYVLSPSGANFRGNRVTR